MIEALCLYAQFLKEFPKHQEQTDSKLVLMSNDTNDTQFIFLLKTADDDMGLRVIRRFRELGMPIQSASMTQAMAKCSYLSNGNYAIYSFIPDPTRIADIIYADAVGKAFARDVMSKLPKEFFK